MSFLLKEKLYFLEENENFFRIDENEEFDFFSYYFHVYDDNGELIDGFNTIFIDIPKKFNNKGPSTDEYIFKNYNKIDWFKELLKKSKDQYKEHYKLNFLFEK